MRAPGPMDQSTRSKINRSATSSRTRCRSNTSLPSRVVAKRCSTSESRGAGSLAISSLAAWIRNLGFEVRAGGPRRSQANSLRMRLRRRASVPAESRIRSARARTYAAYPPSYASTPPPCTSQVRVHTASRNQRSWLTTTSALAGRPVRWSASHPITSTSRWLVGSSSTSTSWPASSTSASATRRRSPPESRPTSESRSTPDRRWETTPRVSGSAAQMWSGLPPTITSRTVAPAAKSSACRR